MLLGFPFADAASKHKNWKMWCVRSVTVTVKSRLVGLSMALFSLHGKGCTIHSWPPRSFKNKSMLIHCQCKHTLHISTDIFLKSKSLRPCFSHVLSIQTLTQTASEIAKTPDEGHLFDALEEELQAMRGYKPSRKPRQAAGVGVWGFGEVRYFPKGPSTPSKKVFWGGFRGLNPFSGGTWTLRVCKRMNLTIAKNLEKNLLLPLRWVFSYPRSTKRFLALPGRASLLGDPHGCTEPLHPRGSRFAPGREWRVVLGDSSFIDFHCLLFKKYIFITFYL